MKKRIFEVIKFFLIALSLSNILFVFGRGSLAGISTNSYHQTGDSFFLLINHTFILCILALAFSFLVFFWIDRFLNKGRSTFFAKLGFIILFLAGLHEIRVYAVSNNAHLLTMQNWIDATIPKSIYFSFFVLLGAAALYVELKRSGTMVSIAQHSLLIISPLFLGTLFYYSNEIASLTKSRQLEIELLDKRELPPIDSTKIRTETRVVWIIYDELDFRVTRNYLDELPELKRFAESSLTATNALMPGHDTLESIPTLLVGKPVKRTEYIGSDDLRLFFKDESTANLKSAAAIIKRGKESGRKIGMVGTYHPYCRVFRDYLDHCVNYDVKFNENGDFDETSNFIDGYGISYFVKRHVLTSMTYFPLWFRLFGEIDPAEMAVLNVEGSENDLNFADASAVRAVSHPGLDLVFVHLPVPHPPYLFDRKTKTWNGKGSYLDNLALVDRSFAKLRSSMEAANLWDSSTVILSADHPWRIDTRPITNSDEAYDLTNRGKFDPRVPFFIKFRDQKRSALYAKPFNTVITSEVISGVFDGSISSSGEFIKFVDSKRAN